jgi:ppGpp synthetase/RelA/SpoT-type nucleotidyltranferase
MPKKEKDTRNLEACKRDSNAQKGSVTEAKNYRPKSLTSIIGKLYEKIIRARILDTIEDSITVRQHGFVSKKSCLSNLLKATDYINVQ